MEATSQQVTQAHTKIKIYNNLISLKKYLQWYWGLIQVWELNWNKEVWEKLRWWESNFAITEQVV